MANTHTTLTSLFSDIAVAIRNKLGSSETIVADTFPDKIAEIEVAPPDGKAWDGGTMPSVRNWDCITYGKGKFVAFGRRLSSSENPVIAQSTDGVNWTESELVKSVSLGRALAYYNGIFLLSCTGTDGAMYSNDGETWNAMTGVSAGANRPVCFSYGNGMYLAAPSARLKTIITSSNGINWTSLNISAAAGRRGIAYGNGRFVMFSESDAPSYSEDGQTWTPVSSITGPSSTLNPKIVYGNGVFVVLPTPIAESSSFYITTNGESWEEISVPSATWRSIVYGNGKFVAFGTASFNSVDVTVEAYSTDGRTWVFKYITFGQPEGNINFEVKDAVWGKGNFVVLLDAKTTSFLYSRTTNDY